MTMSEYVYPTPSTQLTHLYAVSVHPERGKVAFVHLVGLLGTLSISLVASRSHLL